MSQLTFLQLAKRVLAEENAPLSPEEIWNVAQLKGYANAVGTKGKTPWRTIGAQLYVDVRDNPASLFGKTGARPTRFALRSYLESHGGMLPEPPQSLVSTKKQYLEKDLHPFVVHFGFHQLKAYLKTIHHNKSSKKIFGEWEHPDMVGCFFPFQDWENEVVEISSQMGNLPVRLFSFELKRELNYSNLRESFFQAVSNSSWAHEGYLAAAEISGESDFENDLERLSSSFGIGVIEIDIDEPEDTNIKFPARARDFVDWETANKMAVLNPDFREFLKRIKTDVSSREIRRERYDSVLSTEELLKLINKTSNVK